MQKEGIKGRTCRTMFLSLVCLLFLPIVSANNTSILFDENATSVPSFQEFLSELNATVQANKSSPDDMFQDFFELGKKYFFTFFAFFLLVVVVTSTLDRKRI